MKRLMTLLTLCAVTLLLAVPPAGAWPNKKDKKDDKNPDERHKTWRYDRYPDMSFHSGTLRQNGRDGWTVGDLKLVLNKKCVVFGGGGQLQGGRTVVVMGSRVGNTIVARTVHVQKPVPITKELNSDDTQIEWSTSDPTVGVGRAPS